MRCESIRKLQCMLVGLNYEKVSCKQWFHETTMNWWIVLNDFEACKNINKLK